MSFRVPEASRYSWPMSSVVLEVSPPQLPRAAVLASDRQPLDSTTSGLPRSSLVPRSGRAMRVCDPAALQLGTSGWRCIVDQLEPIELIGPRGHVSQHRAQGNKDAPYRVPFVLRQPRCRLQYRASCGQRRDIAERPPLLDSDTQVK